MTLVQSLPARGVSNKCSAANLSAPCPLWVLITVCPALLLEISVFYELLYLCASRFYSDLPLRCESCFVEIVGRALLCVVIVPRDPALMGRTLTL